jgi:hypothetical protein
MYKNYKELEDAKPRDPAALPAETKLLLEAPPPFI